MANGWRSVWCAWGLLAGFCLPAMTWGADEAPKTKSGLKLVAPGAAAAKPGADPYAVPDGTPEEIIDFIDSLRKMRKQFATRDEAVEHAIKIQRAIISAGDKILKQKTDEDTAYAAAEMKLEALGLLASAGIDGALKEGLEASLALSKDSRKDVAEVGQEWYRNLRFMTAPTLDEAARTAMVDEFLSAVTTTKFSRPSISAAIQLGEALEQHPDTKVAGAYYESLAKLLAESDNEGLKQVAEILEASARRLNLPGNLMKVEGKTLAGEKFDWEQYRGKVVLVDFWATWCGPCVAELPNVKANYERFHAKGFDVVGISLDDDKEALTNFIKDEEVPWTNLFAAPVDGEPSEQPAAAYYGITGIPTAILVNREGKVISLMARGEMLTELLEKEFANVPDAPAEKEPAQKPVSDKSTTDKPEEKKPK